MTKPIKRIKCAGIFGLFIAFLRHSGTATEDIPRYHLLIEDKRPKGLNINNVLFRVSNHPVTSYSKNLDSLDEVSKQLIRNYFEYWKSLGLAIQLNFVC
jgi:hypothetical protein